MSTNGQDGLLGQLEKEVNLVFEHTGRLFASAASNHGKIAPTAQVSRLKQVLRTSDRRFQDALDQLEDELQTARLVMRRDLAQLREISGLRKPSQAAHSIAANAMPDSAEISTSGLHAKSTEIDAVEDTPMQDLEPSKTEALSENGHVGPTTTPHLGSDDEPKTDRSAALDEPKASLDTPENGTKPPEAVLALDTQTRPSKDNADAEQPVEEEKPPDTATFSNANDFDSLFGGPMSAGPVDAPGFDLAANPNDEFDFDAFASSLDNNNADNDNISALLPGLEDYANTQPGGAGDTDFDSIFNMLPQEGEQTNIPHRDSTFDDLGDLLDFNMEFDGGAHVGGDSANDEIDFTME